MLNLGLNELYSLLFDSFTEGAAIYETIGLIGVLFFWNLITENSFGVWVFIIVSFRFSYSLNIPSEIFN